MNFLKFTLWLVLIFSLSVSVSVAVLAESRISLRGQVPYAKAELEVSLNENVYYGGKNRIKFDLEGLDPRAVYTIWLEKGSQNKGLGSSPYSFIADSRGRGVYLAGVEAYKLGSWQTIKIVQHKDSLAENMGEDNLATVFIVDIREFLSGKKAASQSQGEIKPKITIYKGPLPVKP